MKLALIDEEGRVSAGELRLIPDGLGVLFKGSQRAGQTLEEFEDCFVRVEDGSFTWALRMREITINTQFCFYQQTLGKLPGTPEIVPCFEAIAGSAPEKKTWKVPEDIRAFLGYSSRSGNYFAFFVAEGSIRAFPLPNIYSDGRICMGEDFDSATARMENPYKNALISKARFDQATYNADLLEDWKKEAAAGFFHWTADGLSQLQTNWSNCRKMAAPAFYWLEESL